MLYDVIKKASLSADKKQSVIYLEKADILYVRMLDKGIEPVKT